MVVFVYSLITLFTYFNVAYVRDFEAVTVNFTTYSLAISSVLACQYSNDITALGMCIALICDSYFAMRFKSDCDEINYSPIENFARKSWTAEAFVSETNVFIQIVGASFIFAQIYLNSVACVDSKSCLYLSGAILGFQVSRLAQYLSQNILGLQLIQSNMVCVTLAMLSTLNLH